VRDEIEERGQGSVFPHEETDHGEEAAGACEQGGRGGGGGASEEEDWRRRRRRRRRGGWVAGRETSRWGKHGGALPVGFPAQGKHREPSGVKNFQTNLANGFST